MFYACACTVQASDLGKYTFLTSLQSRNETLFYRVLSTYLEEMMGIIYTPTVGQACLEYAHIYRRPRGLYINLNDRGRLSEVLSNWPVPDVRIMYVSLAPLLPSTFLPSPLLVSSLLDRASCLRHVFTSAFYSTLALAVLLQCTAMCSTRDENC